MQSPAQRHGGGREGEGRRPGRERCRHGAVPGRAVAAAAPQRPEPPAVRSRSPGAPSKLPEAGEAAAPAPATADSPQLFSRNHSSCGWKTPLRSSRPTCDRTPRCQLDQRTECHASFYLNISRLGDSNTSLGSPLQYLITFSGKKFFLILPNVQPKPTLAQLKSVQGSSTCLQKSQAY